MAELPVRQQGRGAVSDGHKLNLLCLDGGGVRGLSSLHILQRLMEQLDPKNPPKPCEHFDMICGTSTGGLIAIMLGRLRMTVAQCISEYEQLSASVFTKRRHRLNWKGQLQGRFDDEALEDGVKSILRRLNIPEDELLKEADGRPQCKVFVSTMRQEISDIVNLTSYYSPTWGASMLDRVKIWEAARATSAATSFFDPCVIDGKAFADGGTGANNPIHQLWAEASCVYGDGNASRTGTPSRKPFGPDLQDVATALRAIATSAESVAQTFEREHPHLVNGCVYFRFNVTNGLQGVGLEASDRLSEIEALTSSYCASPTITQKMKVCASQLTGAKCDQALGWAQQAVIRFGQRTAPQPCARFGKDDIVKTDPIDLMSFIHCQPFEDWLKGASRSIICITSATISSHSFMFHPAYPLAEKLSKRLSEDRLKEYVTLYVNCFWILDTPKGFRPWALVEEHLKGANKIAGDKTPTETVLEALFYQLLKESVHPCATLEKYCDTLADERAAVFREEIVQNGMPPARELLSVIRFFVAACERRILVAIDSIDYLPETERSAMMALLAEVDVDTPRTKLLFCGASNMVKVGGEASVAVVTDLTEAIECRASLRFDEYNVRKSQIAPAAAGTAEWIWKHPVFSDFASKRSGLLWIRGKPGSGKSVLAKCIQKMLLGSNPRRTLVGDWFYHGRRGAHYIRHRSFLRSVLHQFLEQNLSLFSEYFLDAYRGQGAMTPYEWADGALEDIFKRICCGPFHIICVIDAMDEAENEKILGPLMEIVHGRPGSNASFIVLSRPDIDIERRVYSAPVLVLERENEADIRRIISIGLDALKKSIHSLNFDTPGSIRPRSAVRVRKSRFGSIAMSQAREQEAIERIRTTLSTKAQGSILWVRLVLDKLNQASQESGGATLDDMETLVNKIPRALEEFYRQILAKLIDGKSAETIQEIRRALMWISAAGELGDVTLESLWEALALLKDEFRSDNLDGVWQKQMLITTYDELWRKIYTMCGPFIEVYTPGLSVDESRTTQYKACSVVQLMHQSVRDFLCGNRAAGDLQFSWPEAVHLVEDNLNHYLTLVARDNERNLDLGPQLPEEMVGRLSEQRLLQLALKSVEASSGPGKTMRGLIGNWILEPAPKGGEEALLVSAIEDYLRVAGTWDNPQTTAETLSLGRLFYHACKEGLVTAVRNLLSLEWLALNELRHPFDAILFGCIFFAASRSGNPNMTAALQFPKIASRPIAAPRPNLKDPTFINPMPPERWRETVLADGDPEDTVSRTDRTSSSSDSESSRSDADEDIEEASIDDKGKARKHGAPASPPDTEREIDKTAGLMSSSYARWHSQPWTVELTVRRQGETHVTTCSASFKQWCRFLDILCGSKSRELREGQRGYACVSGPNAPLPRLEVGGSASAICTGMADVHLDDDDDDDDMEDEQIGVPPEDVEDAILASLELINRTRMGVKA
ncbi:Hydantoin utilization protein A [Purpureocillium lavendulum]|uniref:Hydantoin utilization protein A n=1 Tax=Purpureocillium lavendulum TaxID=1247861 RepID=A0AB34FPM9_9HYPO|nr:Hydantoin utilization protein A [Purpureocillium lavendulum]